MVERSYGSFSRSLTLPFAADPGKVKATFKNGVLSISPGGRPPSGGTLTGCRLQFCLGNEHAPSPDRVDRCGASRDLNVLELRAGSYRPYGRRAAARAHRFARSRRQIEVRFR